MTAWNTILDATLALNKPITYTIARIFRDNPVAIAEGSAGSPVIVGLNPKDIQTAANVAALTFTNIPALDLVEFEINALKPATAGAVLMMQVSKDNGSHWVSNYTYAKRIAEISTGGVASGTNEGGYGDTEIELSQTSGGVSNGSNNALSGVLQLLNAGSTSVTKNLNWKVTHGNNTSSGWCVVDGGAIAGVATTDQINAVKFYFSSGNITNGKVVMRARRATTTN